MAEVAYKHLYDGRVLPKMVREAMHWLGIAEFPDGANNPVIMGWAAELGVKRMGAAYTGDSTAWCGLFAGICAFRAGYEPPPICLRARSWMAFGAHSAVPMVGDVLIFSRDAGGHVGLYVGEDDKFFHVLGGNQSDTVCIKRITKSRLMEARRPPYKIGAPWSVRREFVTAGGAAVSESEA